MGRSREVAMPVQVTATLPLLVVAALLVLLAGHQRRPQPTALYTTAHAEVAPFQRVSSPAAAALKTVLSSCVSDK
jgi:hypothetical protein